MSAAAAGLAGGRLVVIAGAPGAGSSLLASAAARTTALEQGRPVLYAASGLTREDVTARMVAAQAAVDYQQLRAQTLLPAQQAATREVFARLSQAPLHIDDGADLSAEAIADTAPYIENLALIVVDRLQHRHAPHLALSGPALPEAARTLAHLAARLRVPVLAALDTDDPDAVAALDPDVTLVLTRRGSEAEVTITERDFGTLSRVRLRADLTRARFTEAAAPAVPPST
ncbi:DnaB-like helicase C-terminal domain-containing protein, partial [Streptacidiphilus griseoplanus]|uniref:DnaB-like helicase C-terminal domain-containing protein n=1 Tax=Peterkaempfera griseoplana TaxID=66896 RepID=UPI001FE1E17E